MNPEQAPAQDTARVFLALVPGDDVLAALAIHRDQWHWNADAARYAPPDWHLTLHFLGAVARHRLGALCAGLDVALPAFHLHLAQAELWPHGIAVVRPDAVPTGLQQLHAGLGLALTGLGLRPDPRPYRPHVTLARHAHQAVPPPCLCAIDWPVQAYSLVESTGQALQRYRVLQQYRLAASAPACGQ